MTQPLPARLLDPTTWIVYRPQRLSDLAVDLTFREAFLRWSGEATIIADGLAAFQTRTPNGNLSELVAHANEIAATSFGHHGIAARNASLRAALTAFADVGLTFRQTADVLGWSLADVVTRSMSSTCRDKAERYALLEDALIGGVLDRESISAVSRRFGVSRPMVRMLATRPVVVNRVVTMVAA